MRDRKAFVKKLEEQMHEWSAILDELKERAKKATTARRAEYTKQVSLLQERRKEAAKKLQELRGASEHAWEGVREAADEAWQEMSSALETALSRIRARSAADSSPTKVSDVMSRDVARCGAGDPLNAAAQIFWERDCGCVPVVDGESHVLGMLTDRDVCMAAYFRNRPLAELAVADVMSKDVVSCGPDDSLSAVEKLMSDRQIRRVPVLDVDRRLVGILSLNDIARQAVHGDGRKRGIHPEEVLATLDAIGERKSRPAALR